MDRDQDITKFSYKSYRLLKKTLGEFDSVVECNEIAIREFIHKVKKHPLGLDAYVGDLSSKHKINVNTIDVKQFSTRIRQYYILSVSQQFEQFLVNYKREWITYFPSKKWIEKQKGETNLINIINNINPPTLSEDLLDCYDYYRLIRNFMAHTDRDLSSIHSQYDTIKKSKNAFLSDFHLSISPNHIDEVNFDDFLILTNIVKHIAYVFSTTAKPANSEIARILFESFSAKKKGSLKKSKHNSGRYENALKNVVSSTFGRFSYFDTQEINTILQDLLA